jgi:thiol-disulfide isomerase/thioredoxin
MPHLARRAIEIALGVAAGLLVYAFIMAARDAYDRERNEPLRLLAPDLVTRRRAPDFELRDGAGRVHELGAGRGRPIVLNLWSTQCPPCIEELPSLAYLAEVARARRTFDVVTVCVDCTPSRLQELLPEAPELLVLLDPRRAVVERRYGTRMFPETFLIDASGDIRARFDGPRDWTSPVVLNLLEGL